MWIVTKSDVVLSFGPFDTKREAMDWIYGQHAPWTYTPLLLLEKEHYEGQDTAPFSKLDPLKGGK